MAKDREYRQLITSPEWGKLRRLKLSAEPLCENCLEQGKIVAATEVHHVKPVEDGLTFADKRALAYDYHNLRSLCHDCHVEAHVHLGRGGKQHAKRRASEHLKRFKDKFLGEKISDDPGG